PSPWDWCPAGTRRSPSRRRTARRGIVPPCSRPRRPRCRGGPPPRPRHRRSSAASRGAPAPPSAHADVGAPRLGVPGWWTLTLLGTWTRLGLHGRTRTAGLREEPHAAVQPRVLVYQVG